VRQWLALQAPQAATLADAAAVVLPGAAMRVHAQPATMAMAIGACWDEACEGLALAHGRPGVPIVAALWADLPARPVPWQAVWQATLCGYEVAARLGARMRILPGMHVDGVWGAFGAAVALVRLRGGSWRQAMAAIEACAAHLPFSLYLPARQGAQARNLFLGHSAWLGRLGADAAMAGWTTTDGALDEAMRLALGGSPAGAWIDDARWLVLESYWKPFAAVRHVHYGAQAAMRWREAGGDPERIESLTLQVYPEALQYCGNRNPQTVLAAQFSLSFGLAAALALGDLSPHAYRPDAFNAPLLRRLEAMVRIEPDAQRFAPPSRGARLVIVTAAGTQVLEQGAVTGDAGHEPTEVQVEHKFTRYTEGDAAMANWAARVRQDPRSALASLP
jgi:2-methylcitrate dehydratase PrpD